MSHLHKRLLLWVALSAMTAACTSSRFYTPNTVNLPTLSQKGEGAASGAVSFGSSHSWEVQGSYSPVRHLGLMANYFAIDYNGSFPGGLSGPFPFPPVPSLIDFTGQMRFGEGGIGCYGYAGKNQEYLFSVFGTAGQGRTLIQYNEPGTPTKHAQWNFWRYALQPGVRMQHKRLRFGAAFRFSYVHHATGRIDARISATELQRIEILETHSPTAFWDVLWTVGYHYRPFLFSLNSTSVALGNRAINELNLASNHISLMATLNLHELRENRASEKKRRK